MKERPILFSAPTVRSILDGRKTQTRRAVKFKKPIGTLTNDEFLKLCPYGKIGDRLWVRETFAKIDDESGFGCGYIEYKASCNNTNDFIWKPSIHMPRWASRILLEITNVRVERLNEISEEDAKSEGSHAINFGYGDCYSLGFKQIWESINGQGSWDLNPWVWVINFARIR